VELLDIISLMPIASWFLADSSPCLAGLFPSKVFGKSRPRHGEESGSSWKSISKPGIYHPSQRNLGLKFKLSGYITVIPAKETV